MRLHALLAIEVQRDVVARSGQHSQRSFREVDDLCSRTRARAAHLIESNRHIGCLKRDVVAANKRRASGSGFQSRPLKPRDFALTDGRLDECESEVDILKSKPGCFGVRRIVAVDIAVVVTINEVRPARSGKAFEPLTPDPHNIRCNTSSISERHGLIAVLQRQSARRLKEIPEPDSGRDREGVEPEVVRVEQHAERIAELRRLIIEPHLAEPRQFASNKLQAIGLFDDFEIHIAVPEPEEPRCDIKRPALRPEGQEVERVAVLRHKAINELDLQRAGERRRARDIDLIKARPGLSPAELDLQSPAGLLQVSINLLSGNDLCLPISLPVLNGHTGQEQPLFEPLHSPREPSLRGNRPQPSTASTAI